MSSEFIKNIEKNTIFYRFLRFYNILIGFKACFCIFQIKIIYIVILQKPIYKKICLQINLNLKQFYNYKQMMPTRNKKINLNFRF
ncbi:hypothetical protein DYQ05_02155 [Treponema pedis]|nr:hypothetical protein DYQ05_02155 [Treponema pedis]